jgi:hypothetical protein
MLLCKCGGPCKSRHFLASNTRCECWAGAAVCNTRQSAFRCCFCFALVAAYDIHALPLPQQPPTTRTLVNLQCLSAYFAVLLLFAGYTGKGCDVAAPDSQPNAKSPTGIEVSGPAYWSSQWIWIDAMKQSSSWMTQALPDT